MKNENELGIKISYSEQMLKAYEQTLYEESLYQTTLRQERSKNKSKYKLYLVLTCILAVIDVVALYIAQAKFLHANPTSTQGALVSWAIGSISLLVGGIVLAFSAAGTAICVIKLIHYARRLGKERDNRDFIWRSYDEMMEISRKNVEETLRLKSKMNADLAVYKVQLAEQIEQKRLAYEAGKDEQENISMSELFYVKETHREALPDKKQKKALVKTW